MWSPSKALFGNQINKRRKIHLHRPGARRGVAGGGVPAPPARPPPRVPGQHRGDGGREPLSARSSGGPQRAFMTTALLPPQHFPRPSTQSPSPRTEPTEGPTSSAEGCPCGLANHIPQGCGGAERERVWGSFSSSGRCSKAHSCLVFDPGVFPAPSHPGKQNTCTHPPTESPVQELKEDG